MFKIDSNLEDVKKQLKSKIESIIDFDKTLREAGFIAVALVSDRVQQHGNKTDGSKITSKAKEKFNAYSYQYGLHRKKKGLQTDIIDITYSGDTLGDFVVVPKGQNNYVVGFRGKTASDRAEWNERRFGVMFQLSPEELKKIVDIIKKRLNASLNKSS